MVDPRPVLIGMNNPHSARPEAALLPHPRGVAGWRLWRMVSDVSGIGRADYVRMTDRRNLLDSRDWDPVAARPRAAALWDELQGRRVVVLGGSVRAALWLSSTTPASWRTDRGVDWAYLPHPSGLCRDYNDPLLRLVAGLLIEEEIERARRQMSA